MGKELSAEIIMKQPKPSCLSIIIPAYNEENYINRCLEAIKKMNTENMDLEIILVDNGSTDKTIEIGKSYGAKVLIKREGTIASLRNYGAKNSKGDLIAFLDADCIVPEDWIEKALKYFRNNSKVILGYRLVVPAGANWIARCWDLLFSKRDVTSEVRWLPTGNMIMKRDAFLSVDGFNETLETNEDCDFCFRVNDKGNKIISSSETSVTHLRPPQSLSAIFKKELWHGKEVFKVFIEDIYRNKDLNIFHTKNIKVVLYAFFYLLCLIFLLFSFALALVTKTVVPLFIAVALPIFVSLLLTLKYTRSIKAFHMMPGMTVLLMIYGVSRGISLLPFKVMKEWILKMRLLR
jgi:glycosyltransferase involved in cell wall biosynthesis